MSKYKDKFLTDQTVTILDSTVMYLATAAPPISNVLTRGFPAQKAPD